MYPMGVSTSPQTQSLVKSQGKSVLIEKKAADIFAIMDFSQEIPSITVNFSLRFVRYFAALPCQAGDLLTIA
jgi:hypothetical protein